MNINKLIEDTINKFIECVENKKENEASLYWDKALLPLFHANFENFYDTFQGWKKKEIARVVKINEFNYLIALKMSEKQNWLKEYSEENKRIPSLNGKNSETCYETRRKYNKYISMINNHEVLQFYTIKVEDSKAFINWSYAALKSLIQEDGLLCIRDDNIEFYSDHKIYKQDMQVINMLGNFIKECSHRYDWVISKVKIIWITNFKYPFIHKSAFLEPTYEGIYIFKNELNIECLKHEVIHQIFWNNYKVWPKAILREGIASAFGDKEVYERNLKEANKKIDLVHLFKDDEFWTGEPLPLILSGLFTKFLLFKNGMGLYEKLYSCESFNVLENLSNIYNMSQETIKNEFSKWINDTYIKINILE